MTWVRLDDKRAMHPKFRNSGFALRGLDEAAICQSAHDETDGVITDELLELIGFFHGLIPKAVHKLALGLCDLERWERKDGGYEIRDFLVYNPSRADLEAKREADRNRKRRQTDSTRIPDGFHEDSTMGSRHPVPSRPVPSRNYPPRPPLVGGTKRANGSNPRAVAVKAKAAKDAYNRSPEGIKRRQLESDLAAALAAGEVGSAAEFETQLAELGGVS